MQRQPSKALKSTLAANLKSLCKGNSQEIYRRVGKKAGISPRSIGYMMSEADGNPTLASIESVATAFKIHPGDLLKANCGLGAEPMLPDQLDLVSKDISEKAHNLIRLLLTVDSIDSNAEEVFAAVEVLLRRSINEKDFAKGNSSVRKILDQYTEASAALSPDSITTLRRQLQKKATRPRNSTPQVDAEQKRTRR